MEKSDIRGIPGQKIAAVGMSWFHEADYAAILRIMTDRDNLPATFALWLQRATQQERDLKAKGHIILRAVIDPQTFPGWCAHRGFTDIDAKARVAFASEYAAGQIGL